MWLSCDYDYVSSFTCITFVCTNTSSMETKPYMISDMYSILEWSDTLPSLYFNDVIVFYYKPPL